MHTGLQYQWALAQVDHNGNGIFQTTAQLEVNVQGTNGVFRSLDLEQEYTLSCNNFMVSGGDGYSMLESISREILDKEVQMVANYLACLHNQSHPLKLASGGTQWRIRQGAVVKRVVTLGLLNPLSGGGYNIPQITWRGHCEVFCLSNQFS